MWLKLIEGEFQHRGGFVIIWSEYDNLSLPIALSCLVISYGLIESSTSSLREKCPSTELFLVRIFPHLDWIRRDTKYLSVFSPNVGIYRPEITPYLDTFHAVVCAIFESHKWIEWRSLSLVKQSYSLYLAKSMNASC